MSTSDPQQAINHTQTTSGSPAAPNDRRATLTAEPKAPPRDGAIFGQPKHETPALDGANVVPAGRSDSQQASCRSNPKTTSPAAFNSDPAMYSSSPDGSTPDRSNVPEQQGQVVPADRSIPGGHFTRALLLWDPVLQTLADGLDDIESTRIAQANRYRILTTTKPDEDGEVRGFGLAENHPAVVALDAQLKTLEFLDASMTKALRKQLKAHPLYPLVTRTKGLGDKTVARLLAAVRDPYWNDLHDRPRTIGELFAFCGVAGPGQRRQRGMKVNWNPDARKRLWIMTGPIIRGDGPYRAVYDAGRERYADKTHTTPCAQCGKKGQPAPEGSEWRDGHKHAGAIRLVMREILRDLWTESRAIYETGIDSQEAAS
jgi:hypothetical protein